MKFTTLYLLENKIEISNSLFGKETIKVNDEIVSEKYSITGAEHVFLLNEQGKEVECKIKLGYGLNGVIFSLYLDNKTIVESPQGGLYAAIFIPLMILSGVGIYFLLSR